MASSYDSYQSLCSVKGHFSNSNLTVLAFDSLSIILSKAPYNGLFNEVTGIVLKLPIKKAPTVCRGFSGTPVLESDFLIG